MRVHYSVFLGDESLLTWLYYNGRLIKVSALNVLTYVLTSVQYSHSTWFLDGRISKLVTKVIPWEIPLKSPFIIQVVIIAFAHIKNRCV